MLNSVVFDRMMRRMQGRSAPNLRTICVDELNAAIVELERAPVKPWFLETTAADSLVADQDYLELPADFLMEVEEGVFEISVEGHWFDLTKVSREKLRVAFRNCDAAFPQAYAVWGNRFLLGPTPTAAYSYRLDYYRRTGAVADNASTVTNSWIIEFFDYVTYKALTIVARDHIRAQDMADNFLAEFRRAEDRFIREVEARRIANETLLLDDEEN